MAKSEQAKAAQAIKKELKKAFPTVKFSVKSESFSMGDAVRVNWEDGPTSKQVDDITSKYQYASFNSMEDISENTNCRDDIPQTKYVTLSRDFSEAATMSAIETIKEVDLIEIKWEYAKNYYGDQVIRITDEMIPNIGQYTTSYVRGHLCKVDFCAIAAAVEKVVEKKETLDQIFTEMDNIKLDFFDACDKVVEKIEPVEYVVETFESLEALEKSREIEKIEVPKEVIEEAKDQTTNYLNGNAEMPQLRVYRPEPVKPVNNISLSCGNYNAVNYEIK